MELQGVRYLLLDLIRHLCLERNASTSDVVCTRGSMTPPKKICFDHGEDEEYANTFDAYATRITLSKDQRPR
jgi:hypothetical protein